MNREERIKAAIAGGEVDRVPINIWMHFSRYDQDPVSLAQVQVDFLERYDFDFIKMMPFGLYTVQDWGRQIEIYCDPLKEPVALESPIQSLEDYKIIEPLSANHGTWGKQLELAQQISRRVASHTPYVQTVFSPMTTLKKLAGDRVLQDMVSHPDIVHKALEAITETTINFIKANINTGVSGFFFATQCAQTDMMTEEQYKEFCQKYDIMVMESYCKETYFNIIHMHGSDVRFELITKEYPCSVVNWHDRNTSPSLMEARKLTDKCLLGGILEAPHFEGNKLVYKSILKTSDPAGITKHVKDAIEMAGEKRLILGPGCVADPRASEENIRAARKAVER